MKIEYSSEEYRENYYKFCTTYIGKQIWDTKRKKYIPKFEAFDQYGYEEDENNYKHLFITNKPGWIGGELRSILEYNKYLKTLNYDYRTRCVQYSCS